MKRDIVLIALFLLALSPGVAHAQAVIGSPIVISGGTVDVGLEVAIYSVELSGGGGTKIVSITVQIDGAGGSPITAVDILDLRLYADQAPGNGVLDLPPPPPPGDNLLGSTAPVNVGAETTVNDASPGEVILPSGKWFFVSIRFNPSAVGKSFTVQAPLNNISADDPPFGPPFTPINGVAPPGLAVTVVASGAPAPSPSPTTSIPAMPSEVYGLIALCVLGYGIYALNRRGW